MNALHPQSLATPNPVLTAKAILNYLEEDTQVFRERLQDYDYRARLAVGMIATASSALDFYSWLMYSDPNGGKNPDNSERFKMLLTDSRDFFSESPDFKHELVYKIVRCGVLHQFFPKLYTQLIAIDDRRTLVCYGERKSINAYGFLRSTVIGLSKAQMALEAESCPISLGHMASRMIKRQESETSLALSSADFSWPEVACDLQTTGTTPPPSLPL
jgi:hypothetical protein